MKKKLKILAAADFHGDIDLAKRLSRKARRNKVDLVVLAGDIVGFEDNGVEMLKPFEEAHQKVVFVPGNWESETEHKAMRKRAKSVDKYYVTYGGVGISGIGSSDWNFNLREGDLKEIKKNFSRMKTGKKILVSHLHAAGTNAEFSGFEGDKDLRKAVEDLQPDLLISAHIHEAEGIEDKIGKTKIIQVGRRGKILEI